MRTSIEALAQLSVLERLLCQWLLTIWSTSSESRVKSGVLVELTELWGTFFRTFSTILPLLSQVSSFDLTVWLVLIFFQDQSEHVGLSR